jgi:hypothetical protein
MKAYYICDAAECTHQATHKIKGEHKGVWYAFAGIFTTKSVRVCEEHKGSCIAEWKERGVKDIFVLKLVVGTIRRE